MGAQGLDVDVIAPTAQPLPDRLTGAIRIADYAQLRCIARQLHPSTELTPEEAWGTYERNWRHVDISALDANEHRLLGDLARALGRKPMDV